MKCLAVLFAALACLLPVLAAEIPMELNLIDGSRIKGRVMSSTGSDITVTSDFGVIHIPMEKLTPESRRAVTEATKPDVDSLLKKVAELEARISQLQQENETLRKQMAARPASGGNAAGSSALAPPASTAGSQPSAAAGGHTISSTGKRHNSGCRYFGSGRPCGPNDGIACKICGG